MLMYGNSFNVITTGTVYNLTSLKEGYVRLQSLIPPNEIGRFTGRDFDIAYANYILSNDFIFKEFFDIVYLLYQGVDVYLIIAEEDWSENLVESLLKLIQQRYGYIGCRIKCFDDFLEASKHSISKFDPVFGLANLSMDRERYVYIIEKARIQSGGPLLIPEEELIRYGN